MIELIQSKLNLKSESSSEEEYKEYISDLILHDKVKSMKNFNQHGNTNCLEHSLFVSYVSYQICRRLGLDFCSAARGGLLHDFFLYEWRTGKPYKGPHGLLHPDIALENANKYFDLNDKEKDIIQNHMWPLTIRLPRYRESYVVLLVDKYCASVELFKLGKTKTINRLKELLEI